MEFSGLAGVKTLVLLNPKKKVKDLWDDERIEKYIARKVAGVDEGEEDEVLPYLHEL
jgi:hypothetical protein